MMIKMQIEKIQIDEKKVDRTIKFKLKMKSQNEDNG